MRDTLGAWHPTCQLTIPILLRVQTFAQADTAGDGIISPQEWLELVTANPSIIDYMTMPDIDCDAAAAQTFAQADTAGDGIISPREWLELVTANPSIIDYMTLPVLKEVRPFTLLTSVTR